LHVIHASHELSILTSLPHTWWDYRYVSSHPPKIVKFHSSIENQMSI
jgi:hypothetical protein